MNRTEVERLLREGRSARAIAAELHVCAKDVAALRTELGLPRARSGKAATPLAELFQQRTRPVEGSHLEWTGHHTNSGVPALRHGGRLHTAYRVAYRLRTGRDPVGKVTAGCDHPGCIAPNHVDDQRDRATYRAVLGA
ncbi:hypothetical protein ACFW6R_04345 [Streptomyces albidoflavus]